MKFLKFLHPSFNLEGPNVTVRKGVKWSDALNPGDMMLVGSLAVAKAIPALVTRVVLYANVDDIHEDMLVLEHDPSCRTRKGLSQELLRVYGEGYADQGLTLVEFELQTDGPMPLIIDNRNIVSDAKGMLYAQAENSMQKARAMELAVDLCPPDDTQGRGRIKAVVERHLAEAGNCTELASILRSRQVALSLLMAYGGTAPNWMLEPESVKVVEAHYGKKPEEEKKGPKLGSMSSKRGVVDCTITIEHGEVSKAEAAMTELNEIVDAAKAEARATLDELAEEEECVLKQNAAQTDWFGNPTSKAIAAMKKLGITAAPIVMPEDPDAEARIGEECGIADAQDDGGGKTIEDCKARFDNAPVGGPAQEGSPAIDLALDEAQVDAIEDDAELFSEAEDEDDEQLCFNCKEPVANAGEACADCQDEIDAEDS